MAMIKCPQCGQEVSEDATKCVHCGLLLKSDTKDRIKKTPQALYDEACAYYKKLSLTVKKIGLILESMEDSVYSTTIALRQMDYILQFVLLGQAASDGEVDHFEQQFIDLITDHGDLLVYLNNKHELNITWDSLELYNNRTMMSILTDLVPDINELSNDFVNYVASVDAALTDHNYYADIRTCVLNIAECLSCVDGDNGDNNAAKLFDLTIGNRYVAKKREVEEQLSSEKKK